VSRSDHHGPGAAGFERRHVETEIVDRYVHRLGVRQPRGPHGRARVDVVVARILERHPPDAEPGQCPQDEDAPLREAAADDDVLLIGGRGPHASQVPGQHLAQGAAASRVAVIEI
jgi:hypothetical protein